MERSEALCSEKEQRLHWHPAFYAGMQIELQDEADKLTFEEEYLLGKEPLRMDMLLIKKNTKDKIRFMHMQCCIRRRRGRRTKSRSKNLHLLLCAIVIRKAC